MWKQQKNGEIVIAGFENGIAASPYDGIADLKGVNISSIKGEVSVAYNRVRVDQPQLSSASCTFNNTTANIGYTGNITPGTCLQFNSLPGGESNFNTSDYYFVLSANKNPGTSFQLCASLENLASGGPITPSANGTATFTTLALGVPIDYCVEFAPSLGYRYYILDANGIVWVAGTGGIAPAPLSSGTLSVNTIFSPITPSGSSLNAFDSGSVANGSLAMMYTTSSSNVITKTWLGVFGENNIYFMNSFTVSGASSGTGWPTTTGSVANSWHTFSYQGTNPHKAIFGIDQVLYWTDGPSVSILTQADGEQFDPTNTATYTYIKQNYLLAPTDNATRICVFPNGNSTSIMVGGLQNNLYIYPSYLVQTAQATGANPTGILWMPESNTQYLLQANNYIVIFAGNKGNIYITNGSSVVPLMTVPDYIAGSVNFVQDPYFVWGGAAYLRGRIFFSIQDSTSSHMGNCGGIWSFVPSFSYFLNQDTGLSLRMEGASSLYSSEGFNGSAPTIIAGSDMNAQEADGPQYLAAWSQTVSATTTNSIDFSGTQPLTNSASIVETDAIPVGTFLQRRTFRQVEVKFAAALAANESITINYRTSLEGSWASAGTVIYDTDRLAAITSEVAFEKAQLIQLQVILNGSTSSPSWIRVKEIYLR